MSTDTMKHLQATTLGIEKDIDREFLEDLRNSFMLGYPISPVGDVEYMKITKKYGNFHINNVGDTFGPPGVIKFQTHEVERTVINKFGELFGFKDPWGYINTGGTEGNMQGFRMGREYLTRNDSQSPQVCIISKEAHYSVSKSAKILNIPTITIPTTLNGEMIISEFKNQLEKIPPKSSLLIGITIGTTMKGGIDNYQEIHELLTKRGAPFYIHADLACYGILYRFCWHTRDLDYFKTKFSSYVNSFSISGHKLLSIPDACGIFVTTKEMLHKSFGEDSDPVPYIGSGDYTICGSRNGRHALYFNAAISDLKLLKKKCFHSLSIAEYLEKKAKEIPAINTSKDAIIRVRRGIILSFDSKNIAEFIRVKYQLASEDGRTHVVCMPHLSTTDIDNLIEDFKTQNDRYIDRNIVKNLVFDTRQLSESHKEAAIEIALKSFGKDYEKSCRSLVEYNISHEIGVVALDGAKVVGLALADPRNFHDGTKDLDNILFWYPIISQDPSIKDQISIEYLITSMITTGRKENPTCMVFVTKNKLPVHLVNNNSLKELSNKKTKGSIPLESVRLYEKELDKYHRNVTVNAAVKHDGADDEEASLVVIKQNRRLFSKVC